MVNLNRPFFIKWTPRMLSVLRIVAGMLMLQHGAQKLFGVLLTDQVPVQPPVFSLLGMAGVLEFFSGLFVTVGLFTRPMAFLLAGEMAVAYFTVHAPRGFWPIENQGELAALYGFIFLFVSVAGGGIWSLDRIWKPDSAPTVHPVGPL